MSDQNQTQTFTLTFGGKKKRKVNGKELPPFTAKTVTIEFAALPETSRTKIIEYGLTQYIGDGAAGAGDQTDFDSGIDARVSKLQSGDFSRESRSPADPYASVERLTAQKVRAAVTAKAKGAGITLSTDRRAELVAAIMANPEKVKPFRDEAETEIAAMKALAAAATETTADDFAKSDSTDAALAALGF